MRKFFNWEIYPVIFICLFLFIICNKDAPRAYRKIQIEKLLEIGSESGDDNYIFNLFSNIPENTETGNAIDIFEPSGKLLQTISLHTPARKMCVKNNKFYILETENFSKVGVCKIKRSK